MAQWEELEKYLAEGVTDFNVHEYAAAQGLSTYEASCNIQFYKHAQRGARSRTLHVIHRKEGTRTRNARWLVGERTRDVRQISRALYDDTRVKVLDAFRPDLERVRVLNPRAGRIVETQVTAVIDGALRVLEAAVMGYGEDEGHEAEVA